MDISNHINKCNEALRENGFVIKTRDDKELIPFNYDSKDKKYLLYDNFTCPWIENANEIQKSDIERILRERIEPWLTALFQSEHLSLLCGSGLTNSISKLAGANGGATMNPIEFTVYKQKLMEAAKVSAEKSGRDKANIEDQIRTANELLQGLKILGEKNAEKLEEELKTVLTNFAISIVKGENDIANADEDNRQNAFNILMNFLLSFCSRTGNRERLHIFTTNYDRLIEAGAELAGIHLIDRFVGNLMPIFRSSRLNLDIHYNPPGIKNEPRYLEGVARYTKLHGSVDWVQVDDEIRRIGLPFGALNIKPYLDAPGLKGCDELKLIIYPNSAKDKETAEYPYVELFRDLAASICRPNSTLVTYGYGFGDDHINRVIKDMLTIPSTHLVIISYDNTGNRILNFYKKVGRPSQITVLIGSMFGGIQSLTQNFLPKAAIDNATLRMSELLQKRMGPTNSSVGTIKKSSSTSK